MFERLHRFGNYLHGYQVAMGIPIRTNSTVTKVGKDSAGNWEVDVLDESASPQTLRYRPRIVISATGLFPQTQPNRIDLLGMNDFRGEVLHSVDYHSGARFKGKRVLLVGFGNSANDLICDLWEEGADVTTLIRSPVSLVPRSLWMFIETLTYRAQYVNARTACENVSTSHDINLMLSIPFADTVCSWLRRLVANQVAGAREEVEPWRECFSVDPVKATAEVEAVMKVVDTVAKCDICVHQRSHAPLLPVARANNHLVPSQVRCTPRICVYQRQRCGAQRSRTDRMLGGAWRGSSD